MLQSLDLSTKRGFSVPGKTPELSSFSIQVSRAFQNAAIYITTHVPPIKDKKIEIFYHPLAGLTAVVHFLDEQGKVYETTSPLPLTDLPKETHFCPPSHLQKVFVHTHLIPKKGVEGTYNRVSFRWSAKGGVKAAIPFQPGLALGSVVRGETLEKMEKYAAKIAEREAREQQIKAAEERLEQLQAKIDARAKRGKGENDPLLKLWNVEVGEVNKFITELAGKMQAQKAEEVPVFENFYQAVETPLDINSSQMEVQPRAFDSLQYNSQYISMTENNEDIHDKISHSSSSSQASVSGGVWCFKAQGSHAWADAVSSRVLDIKKSKKAVGVLVINAVVTTRNVRCFTHLQFDPLKLETILDVMKQGQSLDRYGITTDEEGNKKLYLLTEAVLGGSFTALVTFLDEEQMNRKLEKRQEEHSSSSSVSGGIGGWFWNASAAYATSSQSGRQTEDDILRGITTTKVDIEIISQGAMPIFARDVIEREIIKHIDLNPSNFELSAKDEEEARAIAQSKGSVNMEMIARRQIKMQNVQVAAINAYRGLAASKEKQQLHTPNSVMQAYDNFATQLAEDEDCGVPIGFNYQVFTEDRLRRISKEIAEGREQDRLSYKGRASNMDSSGLEEKEKGDASANSANANPSKNKKNNNPK